MKLTNTQLRQIIKEELQATLREGSELSPLADKILNFMKDRLFNKGKFSIEPSELMKIFGAGAKAALAMAALKELTSPNPTQELFYDVDNDGVGYYYIDPDSYGA